MDDVKEEIKQKDELQARIAREIPIEIAQFEGEAERFRHQAVGFREAGKKVALESHDIALGKEDGLFVFIVFTIVIIIFLLSLLFFIFLIFNF